MTIAAAVIVMAVMGSNGAMVQNETEKNTMTAHSPGSSSQSLAVS
jgi:hypothetical protein